MYPSFSQVPEKDEQDDEHKDANVSWLLLACLKMKKQKKNSPFHLRSIRGSETT